MRAAGGGRIVNVISTSVKQPLDGLGVSNTVRGAVANWAKDAGQRARPRRHHRKQRAARGRHAQRAWTRSQKPRRPKRDSAPMKSWPPWPASSAACADSGEAREESARPSPSLCSPCSRLHQRHQPAGGRGPNAFPLSPEQGCSSPGPTLKNFALLGVATATPLPSYFCTARQSKRHLIVTMEHPRVQAFMAEAQRRNPNEPEFLAGR